MLCIGSGYHVFPAAPMPSTSTASYTAASNQVASVNGGAGLNYDAAGDVTQDPLNSYLYDAEGRLCAARTAGPSLTGYIYDASGIRVAKGSLTSFSCNFATNGFTPTSSYVLGPGGEQVTEYAVSGPAGNYASTWQHTNAFDGGHLQATYHDTGTYFYLGDWLGTKRVEVGTNSNGNGIGCAAAFTSLPYGDGLTTVALPGYNACSSDATEHHFTGKERDAESGNDYFAARYYASSMGRFMSPDWSAKEEPVPYAKMDDPQTLNLYAYVGNNPMTRFDADGHCGPYEVGCLAMEAIHRMEGILNLPTMPLPPPAPPAAPPIAMLTTSIRGGTTSLTISTHEKTTTTDTWESLTKVDSQYQKDHPTHTWLGKPLRVDIVGVETGPGVAGTRAYGPSGAAIKTDDPHGQWLHGGGRRSDWSEPYQGLVPTYGCTRMHNQDVISLGHLMTGFMRDNPASGPVVWERTQ